MQKTFFVLLLLCCSISPAESADSDGVKAIKDAVNVLDARKRRSRKSEDIALIDKGIAALQATITPDAKPAKPKPVDLATAKIIELGSDGVVDFADNTEKYLGQIVRLKARVHDEHYRSIDRTSIRTAQNGFWVKFRAIGSKGENVTMAFYGFPDSIKVPEAHHGDELILTIQVNAASVENAENTVLAIDRP